MLIQQLIYALCHPPADYQPPITATDSHNGCVSLPSFVYKGEQYAGYRMGVHRWGAAKCAEIDPMEQHSREDAVTWVHPTIFPPLNLEPKTASPPEKPSHIYFGSYKAPCCACDIYSML